MAKAVLAAALLVFGAGAAGAQMRPSSTAEIVAAVKDCAAASGAEGVSEQALLGAGYSRATMKQDGKTVAADIGIYGKAKANPMLMTDAMNGKAGTVCFVTARFREVSDYQMLVNAIDALDKTDAIKKDGLTIFFSNGSHLIQTAMTGSREQPGVRVAVMSTAGANK